LEKRSRIDDPVSEHVECVLVEADAPVRPYTVVSLKEIMAIFDAWGLALLWHHMDDLRKYAISMCDLGIRDQQVGDDVVKERIAPLFVHAQICAKGAYLQSTYDRVQDQGAFNMLSKVGITWEQLKSELKVLRECIESDLQKHMFLVIPPKMHDLIQQMPQVWGETIWKVMPETQFDTRQAIGCVAMELETASVFHFMRIAEYGLRHLAKKLSVKLTHKGKPHPIEYADWEKVIDALKIKIARVRQLPLGPSRQEKLTHARKPYKSHEALAAMERVRDFMRFIAEDL
jgi:hypothetical protein